MSPALEAAAPNLSEAEEHKFVEDNLRFIEKVFDKLKLNEARLPTKSKRRLVNFKRTYHDFFELPDNYDEPSNEDPDEQPTNSKATGAIPKTRKSKQNKSVVNSRKQLRYDCSSTSSSPAGDDSDAGASSVSSPDEISLKQKVASKQKAKLQRDLHANMQPQDALALISKFDNRRAPVLAVYNEKSGKSLIKYFRQFESYCANNIKGDKNSWIDELENHLTGKTLEAFRSYCDIDDTYDNIKLKLCDWYEDLGEIRLERCKSDFKRAKYREGESVHLFTNRLARLFKLAYPSRKNNMSSTLRNKLLSTAPKSFGRAVESQIMSKSVRGKLVSWAEVQILARKHDLMREMRREKSESSSSEDFEVSVSSAKKMRDVSIQHSPDPSRPIENTVASQGNAQERNVKSPPWYAQLQRGDLNADTSCHYCGRLGHFARDCRKRQNLCFSCGSDQHHVRQCQSYNQEYQQTQPGRSQSQPPRPNWQPRGDMRQYSGSRPSNTWQSEQIMEPQGSQNFGGQPHAPQLQSYAPQPHAQQPQPALNDSALTQRR